MVVVKEKCWKFSRVYIVQQNKQHRDICLASNKKFTKKKNMGKVHGGTWKFKRLSFLLKAIWLLHVDLLRQISIEKCCFNVQVFNTHLS